MRQVISIDGRVIGTHDFVRGFVALKCPRRSVSDDDILAFALYMEKSGYPDEALAFLERSLDGYRLH